MVVDVFPDFFPHTLIAFVKTYPMTPIRELLKINIVAV